MKKILFALAIAAGTLSAIAPAYADDHDHPPVRHHQVCHNVREHGHWVKHCR